MLDDLLSFDAVQRLTDARSFSLGEDYYRSGAVSGLTLWDNRITAIVQGSELYNVSLSAKDGVLDFSCTCPYHDDDGAFCKHCVAVALAYTRDHSGFRTVDVSDAEPAPKRRASPRAGKNVTAEHLRVWLSAQSIEELSALVWEHAKEDLDWRRRLFVRVAANSRQGVNIAALRKTIESATKARAYPDAKQIKVYLKNVGEVIVTLRELLAIGDAPPVQELALLASDRVQEVYARTNSSESDLRKVVEELIAVYREAVFAAPPDPVELAAHLYERQITGDYGFWKNAEQAFDRVLGAGGKQEMRRLTETEWHTFKPLTHDEKYTSYEPRRARVAERMEGYARAENDTDALVRVLEKDLRNSTRYGVIVHVLRDAGRHDDACHWIEKTMAIFGAAISTDAREYLLGTYRARGETGRALAFLWKQFGEVPSVENYALLREYADPPGEWDKWREQAIALLTERIAAQSAKPLGAYYGRHEPSPTERLIRIYLFEDNADAAFALSQTRVVSDDAQYAIAEAREGTYPDEALAVYLRLLLKAVQNNDTDEPEKLLRSLRRVYEAIGKSGEFATLIAGLKVQYPRKRLLLAAIKNTEP